MSVVSNYFFKGQFCITDIFLLYTHTIYNSSHCALKPLVEGTGVEKNSLKPFHYIYKANPKSYESDIKLQTKFLYSNNDFYS